MKYKSIAILMFCVSLSATVLAQGDDKEITGVGTPNFITKFSGKRRVSNSTIFQSPSGNIGIGTTTPDSTLAVFNFSDSLTPDGLQPYAIYGFLTTSTINFSAAIRGDSLATTGGGNGVIGLTSSAGGAGVRGVSVASDGGYGVIGGVTSNSGGGVLGTTNATSGFTNAVRGDAFGTSGGSVAIYGEQFSPDAPAGLFINRASGDILNGRISQPDISVFRVDGTGRVFADGGFQPSGADFAESMPVAGDRTKYAAGDLLVIDPTAHRRLALSQQPYSTLVAGIYSTKPGMLGTTRSVDDPAPQNEVPLAVVGIVPCKVTAENGPIQTGDLLVTSSTAGHAMKGTDTARCLVP